MRNDSRIIHYWLILRSPDYEYSHERRIGNAERRQAKRRKSTAFIEKIHICMETVIEKFVLCMV